MSIVVSTCSQINQSPLNTSPSKQLYSFPKDQRFKQDMKPLCSTAFYDLPDMFSKRKAGIGYGTKYDFTKYQSKTPAPNQYDQKSIFDPNKRSNISFGLSRDQLQGQGIFGNMKSKVNSPGPGQYDKKSTLSSIKFSIRSRPGSIFKQENVPGPGAYSSLPSINPSGKHILSKYKNYGSSVFNPSSSLRFSKDGKDKVPGAQYKLIDGFSKEGKYILSSHKSSSVRSFSHGIRSSINSGQENTPGPGQYRLPSDFGHYQSSTMKS